MKTAFKVSLSPAELYYLRQLVLRHANTGEQGWAELREKLDDLWSSASRREREYGAFPHRCFSDFRKMTSGPADP